MTPPAGFTFMGSIAKQGDGTQSYLLFVYTGLPPVSYPVIGRQKAIKAASTKAALLRVSAEGLIKIKLKDRTGEK